VGKRGSLEKGMAALRDSEKGSVSWGDALKGGRD